MNTFTKEVWNLDEEWKHVVNASEETLVDDDFSITAQLKEYTYQSYKKSY